MEKQQESNLKLPEEIGPVVLDMDVLTTILLIDDSTR